jgi:carboxynorspermidine decarboxylase
MYRFYPLISEYLDGFAASGYYEARLAKEHGGGENHVFSPAYREDEFAELIGLCDHIVFNSVPQLKKFAPRARERGVSIGLRLNPEHSTQAHAIYDPCAPDSRLGVRCRDWEDSALELIDGFHYHTLCEQGADALAETLAALESKFGDLLPKVKWLNLGGGHHITKSGYDLKLLKTLIEHLQQKYRLEIYLEPGEAVALDAGFLVSSVLEVQSDQPNVILDASAACHMPDVLEMPYTPPVIGAAAQGKKAHNYILTGPTCLAGDVIGRYSFDSPLKEGDRVVFGDMAIYTMVKTNTFNGMPLPKIIATEGDEWQIVNEFDYDDFKRRL